MKQFHRYVPESPELLAAREAEERSHAEFCEWQRWSAYRSARHHSSWGVSDLIVFSREAK